MLIRPRRKMGRVSEANLHPLCMYAPTGQQSHSGRRYGKPDNISTRLSKPLSRRGRCEDKIHQTPGSVALLLNSRR